MVPVIGASRKVRRIRKREGAFRVAGYIVGMQYDRRGDGLDMPGGRERAGDVVCRDPVGRDLELAGRSGVERSDESQGRE